MTELRFDGRVAIVTGAGRGIGRSHALLLARRGARVVVADYGGALEGGGEGSRAPADAVVGEIRAAGGEATACYASVADEFGAAAIVETALGAYSRLDIVVNNAGISDLKLFEDLGPDDFRRMIDVHYLGAAFVAREAWKPMKAAGYGRIINTCSEATLGIHPMVTSYGGAKGGVFGLTRTLAAEGPRHGILVNAIAPRAHTRLGSEDSVVKVFNMPREFVANIVQTMPPELVSPAMAFLAHDSCALNGELFVVGAGQVQRLTVQVSAGIQSPSLTPEFIAENLGALLDRTGSQLVEVNAEIRRNAAE